MDLKILGVGIAITFALIALSAITLYLSFRIKETFREDKRTGVQIAKIGFIIGTLFLASGMFYFFGQALIQPIVQNNISNNTSAIAPMQYNQGKVYNFEPFNDSTKLTAAIPIVEPTTTSTPTYTNTNRWGDYYSPATPTKTMPAGSSNSNSKNTVSSPQKSFESDPLTRPAIIPPKNITTIKAPVSTPVTVQPVPTRSSPFPNYPMAPTEVATPFVPVTPTTPTPVPTKSIWIPTRNPQPTGTPAPTPIPTAEWTPSSTPIEVVTSIPTATPTTIPIETVIPSPTATPTPIPTVGLTPISTPIESTTPIITPTVEPTTISIPIETAIPTVIPTPTETASPTVTVIGTPTTTLT